MAYKKSAIYTCETQGCTAMAKFTVHNWRNALMGRHCKHHADKRVKEINADERARSLKQ